MSLAIRSAMVLAAGLGTRMRPLTDTIPKPLVPLAGRPLIDHVLDRIAQAGIPQAVVNVHHHADLLEAHVRRRRTPDIVVSDERAAVLDTGGGVLKALPKLGPEPFLVHNSDSVWTEGIASNIGRLAAAWDDARMDGLLLLAPVIAALGYDGPGDFALEPDGRLRRRARHEVVPFVFAGVSIAHPRLLADLADIVPVDRAQKAPRFSLNLPWNRAIDRGRLFGIRMEGVWMHVGTPAALAAAERYLATGETA